MSSSYDDTGIHTLSRDFFWRQLLWPLEFCAPRTRQSGLKLVVIYEIGVEITLSRDNRLLVYLHLIFAVCGRDVRIFYGRTACRTFLLRLHKTALKTWTGVRQENATYLRFLEPNISWLEVVRRFDVLCGFRA